MNEPLRNKGGKIIELVDSIITMVRNNTAKLQESGLPVYIDESEIIQKRELALKEFKDKKMYDSDEIKSAIEWLRDEMCKLGVKKGYIKGNMPLIPQIAMGRLIDQAFPDLCPSEDIIAVKKQTAVIDK